MKVKTNDPNDIYLVKYSIPNNFICKANSEEHAKEKAIKYYQEKEKIPEVTVIDVKEFQYFYYENMVVEVESKETNE